jgi:hypothetical protein
MFSTNVRNDIQNTIQNTIQNYVTRFEPMFGTTGAQMTTQFSRTSK